MAESYPSSNPFRRKSTTPFISPETPTPNIINHIAYQQPQPLADFTNLQKSDAPKKAAKKVRVQSPPPSSPSTTSIPDSSSTIGEDISTNPRISIPQDDDPFDGKNSTSSEDEGGIRPSQAPHNPFSRTLATMERTEKESSVQPSANIASPGRASMDVEAFKRLLLTGNAGLGLFTPPTTSPAHLHHGLGDGGSSTDTSSISRQSIFEPVQESHTETPRTSHEISEPEDYRRGITAEFSSATSARKKPLPPSSRHGKLIKLELRDGPSTPSPPVALASSQPPTPRSSTSQQIFTAGTLYSSPPNGSSTDLNKPLPPAPKRASHDSDRESIFDKESAGKTPEPPSPPLSLRRKQPPAPPLTRRHSQLVSESKITRDTGRLSPKSEEEGSSPIIPTGRPRSDTTRSASSGTTAGPPPPPSRRSLSVRHSTHPALASPSSASLPVLPPPTPPARGSSRSTSGRPPSVASMDMGSEERKAGKRAGMAPPPPPKRQVGRRSMDEGGRASEEMGRRIGESVRKASGGSLQSERESEGEGVGSPPPPPMTDIMADLSKLRREIDALRASAGAD